MKRTNIFLIFLLYLPFLVKTQPNEDKCDIWSKKYVKPTRHLEYFNVSVFLIEFDDFADINSIDCERFLFKNLTRLRLKSKHSNNLLPTNFNIDSLLYLFQFKYETIVSVRNLKGFLMKSNPSYIENEISLLELYDLNFDFYFSESEQLITGENCLLENFKNLDFLSSTFGLILEKGTLYTRPVCPYVFLGSQLKNVKFNHLANSLIFRNKLSFIGLNDNETRYFNLTKLVYLSLGVAYMDINEEMVNKYVFRDLVQFDVRGVVMSIEDSFFSNFKLLKLITIQSDNFAIFMNKGLKWLDCINEDVKIRLDENQING